MGTDIFPWIEFDAGDLEPFTKESNIDSITAGEFIIGRDYQLFAVLAGVRASQGESPLFTPRGIPNILSTPVSMAYYYRVVDKTDRPWPSPHQMSRDSAEYHIRAGSSHYHLLREVSENWVSNPEFHHPGWLYYEELKTVIQRVSNLDARSIPHSGELLLRVMEHISAQFEIGYKHIRFVFWFHG